MNSWPLKNAFSPRSLPKGTIIFPFWGSAWWTWLRKIFCIHGLGNQKLWMPNPALCLTYYDWAILSPCQPLDFSSEGLKLHSHALWLLSNFSFLEAPIFNVPRGQLNAVLGLIPPRPIPLSPICFSHIRAALGLGNILFTAVRHQPHLAPRFSLWKLEVMG